MRSQTSTLLQDLLRRVGFKEAMRVGTFMAAWDACEQELGREPTVREYAAWWREPESTAFKHLSEFRRALPSERTPTRLMAIARERKCSNVLTMQWGTP